MLREICTILCLVFVVMLASCVTPPAPAPSLDTREADVQAVHDVEAASLKVLAEKDVDKYFGYIADDAVGMYPGMPLLEGKEAIRNAVGPMIPDPNYSFIVKSSRQEASTNGDLVYSLGTYVMTMTDVKTKQPKTENGKFLTIYRKQSDGSWKIVADACVADPAM